MNTVELYPHQRKAVDEMHNGCILWGGVGSGKSLTSLAYFIEKECNGRIGDPGSIRAGRDVYIITTAKKRDSLDWQADAIKFGLYRERDSSVGGIALTVDSWNNIGKYEGVKDAFFIFDEQRVIGGGSWTKSFIKIAKRNRWILLSATPGDTWLDYIPVFVANGYYKNRSEFKREHVVYSAYTKFPKVERYLAVNKLIRLRNQTLVRMPYRKHTTRVDHFVKVEYDKELYKKVVEKRWHVYEHRPLKNVSELFSVMRKVVNSDSSRVDSLQTILSTHQKVIVFYNFDYELEMLREIASSLKKSPNTESTTKSHPEERSPQWTETQQKTQRLGSSHSHSQLDSTLELRQSPSSVRTVANDSTVSSARGSVKKQSSSYSTDTRSPIEPHTNKDPKSSVSTLSQISNSNLRGESWTRSGTQVREQTPELAGIESSNRNTDPTASEGLNVAPAESKSPRKCDLESSTSTTLTTEFGSTSIKPTSEQSPNGLTSVNSKVQSSGSTFTTTDVAFAEWNGHKHEEIPTSDRWIYAVQYAAGSEGWNCVATDTVIFLSLSYSYKMFEQAKGRIDRLNTLYSTLHYYIMRSNSPIDSAIWKALESKKDFNVGKFLADLT